MTPLVRCLVRPNASPLLLSVLGGFKEIANSMGNNWKIFLGTLDHWKLTSSKHKGLTTAVTRNLCTSIYR